MSRRNAIIMAAGMASRFVPLSYEIPKGLICVRGEVLIERQIRQLHEAGIRDITIVLGYKKEKFFYLKEKYQVDIIINEEYEKYNNTSSLMKVLEKIDNTYICSSDNYFTKNVFVEEKKGAYYAVVYHEGAANEYFVSFNESEIIQNVKIGGENGYIMLGHVFFDHNFSQKFKKILKKEYQKEKTRKELWEQMYMRYILDLPLKAKKYEKDIIFEFDSLEDLRDFEPKFQSDSILLKEIQHYFSCEEFELSNFILDKKTEEIFSFFFFYSGKRYQYHLNIKKNQYVIQEIEK